MEEQKIWHDFINEGLRLRNSDLTPAEQRAAQESLGIAKDLRIEAARRRDELERSNRAFREGVELAQNLLQIWGELRGIVGSGDPLGGAVSGALAS